MTKGTTLMAENQQTTEIAYLPPAAPPTNHGHTVAAWFTMIGIMVGALVAAIGVVVAAVWLFWVGMGVVAVALIGGLVLRNAGYGQKQATR
ncbi:HGxxPAAW family protein [Cellulosimicrobium cellulans]|uniref:HGxxPAAW family protein n=2 Tax=Cellulosimicrobium TaxID=157920 RepID=UPI00209713B9|nr:HGxxPAAW family protein [Cellulosimicrobium cellulans]